MLNNLARGKVFFLGVLIPVAFYASLAFASETNGTIDGTYKYAWGENIGWVNFDCDNCDVSVTDGSLTGYAWSAQYGWINLNPDNSGVENDAEGTLSGYAWGSNLGWINFTGVTIDEDGDFSGYATIESDSSRINFNCATGDSCASSDFKVKTDWIPASARSTGSSSGSYVLLPQTLPPVVAPPVAGDINEIPKVFYPPLSASAWDSFLNLFKPKKPAETEIVQVPEIAPLSFKMIWNLLPTKAIEAFVFAPLPYEVRILANKFPELNRTLKSVGVERLTDMSKLSGVTLNLPGLTELSNLIEKKNLPAEFVFARASGELVDLNVAMSIGDKGEVLQKISSLPGKTLRLVVKPISKARSVTGYIVFRATTPKVSEIEISRSSLAASVLFSMDGLVEKTSKPVSVENKLVLSSFEYTDPDRDGIYTADVISPSVPGEYEVITVIDYVDPVLGTRQMRMITVIDPEGYVFEKNNSKETRIPSAIVSLYVLNNATKKYELWAAKDYQQENPQVTDIRGTYSFLVPEGSYYFQIEAPGYNSFQGKVFVVAEGSGIHQNIELKSNRGWFSMFDWKTILLIVVLLLLVYNLYRSTLRDKLLKFSNK
ncbi:MAG: hypothetical protein UU13_C0018G0009 [Candidatus Nomurabacteria bacterium GW2011_GWB1_40_7]|uniref:Carboxypeptidase regulatory-like domain-containing protein n=1 Tax=Candidatus Nomurabacteria bacterium GW2011_GWB1_40_7 TaxID=1618744 RepID=A0A0G0W3T4_9BACT|nr:MAG: hypothetical protein UU13_C0018G0009 [Candidatus Nomurabacteria bacterium GW2011_GWB1_40_7]